MQCFLVLLFVLTTSLKIIHGSLVQINASTFSLLPPLFALDDWNLCRAPGDEYCMVDAELRHDGPSPTLDLLREYSQQTTKHYNRSRIHRGVCVTRCTNDSDVTRLAAVGRCVNDTVFKQYGLQASILSMGWCSSSAARSSLTFTVLVLCLCILAVIATILHLTGLVGDTGGMTGSNYILAFSVKKNWSILTYNRAQPRSDDRMKNLACLEGIRVLAIHCVIFSHVLFMYIYSYTDNPHYIEQMYDNFGWQIMFNSPLWLQAFFAISAFLTTYTMLICSEKKPLTLLTCVVAVATRWIRLTPTAVFALWFTISWFPLLGSGPQWGWLVTREADDCAERWWYHLLYVHNYLDTGKMCMGHTWYLAVDMQLHVLGILLLFVFIRWRKAVWPVLAALLGFGVFISGLVAFLYGLQPIITAQAPELLRTLFANSTLMSWLYLPSYMNVPGYAAGMAVAVLLYDSQRDGVKLSENKWLTHAFHLSLHAGSAVVLAGTVFLRDGTAAAAAAYSAVDRTLVAVAFAVFMLGCVAGCRSVIRRMLDWRGFHTLGRLSYCAFLIHFIVLRLTLASDTRLHHASVISCICLFITTSIFTYIASIPLCLLVELPFTQLWKAAVDPPRQEQRAVAEESNGPNKSLDLVANVRISL